MTIQPRFNQRFLCHTFVSLTIVLTFHLTKVSAATNQSTDLEVLQAYNAGLLQGTIECNKKWLVKFRALNYKYQYWDSVRKVEPRIRKFNQDFDHRKPGAK